MATYTERASDLLSKAEKALRDLVSEAAMSGDYSSVVRIAEWAQTIRELLHGKQALQVRSHRTAKAKPTAGKSHVSRKQGEYPRFFRNDNELIRVAWSKRAKRQYRHKAAYSVVEAVARAMHEKGAEGRVFSTDVFLPVRDREAEDIPNYQVYVAIALLKHAGLIDQHGRQGYSIRQPHDFRNAVEAVWKNLPRQ